MRYIQKAKHKNPLSFRRQKENPLRIKTDKDIISENFLEVKRLCTDILDDLGYKLNETQIESKGIIVTMMKITERDRKLKASILKGKLHEKKHP